MSNRPLLLEIGCEELPSSILKQLGQSLEKALLQQLAERGLSHGDSRWFASPRRLAVLVDALEEQAADQSREALGPPLAQARDDSGAWTRAAEGFAARQKISVDALEVIDTPKGPRVGCRQVIVGARSADCLGEVVGLAVAALPIPKRMRWGAGRTEFARPVHWVVLLYGDQDGFGDILGIQSGRQSKGHRFHAPQSFSIDSPLHYEAQLQSARVVADFGKRREQIRAQVTALAEKLQAEALIDEALLDEVTSLVEWPTALAGSFDEAFLEVPAEALISSMQSHQKYFPVVSADSTRRLLPHFITVSNIESRDPAQVVAGNERVIRPRLADARFFFEQDRQSALATRVDKLGGVVFQKKLGTLLEKVLRVQSLAGEVAGLIGADRELAERAAYLCKADLVSEMVLEFSDLQGIAGAYYARHDGEAAATADAIEQHYWPTQAGGRLPEGPEAVCVALADRLDTLVGIFGIGQTPSGSKDPFALRRAAIAVLRICIEKALPLDLRSCLRLAVNSYKEGIVDPQTADKVFDYVMDRLPALYESEQIPVEVFRAVRAAGVSVPLDISRRIRAVQAFSLRPEALALAAANKRVANILGKLEVGHVFDKVSTHLLREDSEKSLSQALQETAGSTAKALASNDYAAALGELAGLRDGVDAFFDGVMVNSDDPALRNNRLNLLHQLRAEFLAVADISLLGGQ
ncbi:MAG: glycyl-tRNA synthetase beta chain [Halieaceae bacterium]|jgi:glycyl-tRNA synthetase beta chain